MRLPFKLFSLFAAISSSNAVLHGMTAKQQARLRAKALRERFGRMARYPVRPRPSDSGPYPEPDPHQSSPIFRRGRGSDGSEAIYVHSSDSECHEDSGANARPSSSSSGLHSATAETGMHESMSQSVVQHGATSAAPPPLSQRSQAASSVATTIIEGDASQSQSDNEMPQHSQSDGMLQALSEALLGAPKPQQDMPQHSQSDSMLQALLGAAKPQQDMPQQSQPDSLLQALLTADKPQQDQDMPQQAQDMPQPLHGEPQQAQDMPQQAQDMPQQAQDPPSPPSLHGEPVEESIDYSLMLAQDDGWDPRLFRNPSAAQITRWMQGTLRHGEGEGN